MINRQKLVALCVDDYGQHIGIDDAVLKLLELRRISAVSCMSNAPDWLHKAAPKLKEHKGRADFGLHFNLTETFTPGKAISLPVFILKSYLGLLHPKKIRNAFEIQLDQFEDAMGCAPDFVDGHQHIHQLPRISDLVLEVLKTRYPNKSLWVRNTVPACDAWRGKARLLANLGGRHLESKLRSSKIATNTGFAGVYNFKDQDYALKFIQWSGAMKTGGLIMSHPGASYFAADAISKQRLMEYAFFRSAQFEEILIGHEIKIERLSTIIAAQTT
jgi:predicted glycoside hydrolase/deacetylase ChbG (UPF0249 family)